MMQRVACPILVSRDEEIAVLEDALLAANRGEGRLVAVAGEAGMGKTRLVTELTRRAEKLGNEVLWGGCSEVDLSLPYLPFIEAIGNYLESAEAAAITERLGLFAGVLGQIFPQLGVPPTGEAGDPGSAKARLFEAVVGLLAIPARERGLLLVVDDIHWADASTRELLDHLARRLPSMRALAVVTYRSDEIDRRHPLLPTVQAWRRSRTVETVAVEALEVKDVVSMLRAILEEKDISVELADLMHERCEGNPFVLEEILREAIDRGDLFRTAGGWDRKPIEAFAVPDSVRDTIILRLGRLDPAHVPVLEAAAILGRRFDHVALASVADLPADIVDSALAAALSQQLIEEDPQSGFRWRHALTQEAIYDEIVISRRQRLHSRAADALARVGHAAERAYHLLEAGRFDEAVEQSITAGAEAIAAFAFEDGVRLYERIVPHISDDRQRAEVMCRLGVAYASADRPAKSADVLSEGIAMLETFGEQDRATHYRLYLGRAMWIMMQPERALEEYERALTFLEPRGPSADLALVHFRIGSHALFANEFDECRKHMERAIEIASRVGAERERIHSMSFLGLAQIDLGDPDRGVATIDEAFDAAMSGGHLFEAANSQWNAIWLAVHLMLPGSERLMKRFEPLADFTGRSWYLIARSYTRRATGELHAALDDARLALEDAKGLDNAKLIWRTRVQAGEVLTEMGRIDEAIEMLPWPPMEAEGQDHVYEAPAQVHARLAAGRIDEAVAVAELILRNGELVANYSETLAAGVEAFAAAGRFDDARALLETGVRRAFPTGGAWLRHADALIRLGTGDAADALAAVLPGIDEADDAGFRVAATRLRVLGARAAAAAGDLERAEDLARRAARDADEMGAGLLAGAARIEAAGIGVEIVEIPVTGSAAEEMVPVGERMVTSMFADIRGYTAMTVATPPEAMAERITSFYRMAKIEVERNGGVIDKFAGDAVMATFNISGHTVDHPLQAVKAALGLRDRAVLLDLPIGIGIAVGPAIVGHPIEGSNAMTVGSSVNLAARLQTEASAGEVIMSEDAYQRVAPWLNERGLDASLEELRLKGFEAPQAAYRLSP